VALTGAIAFATTNVSHATAIRVFGANRIATAYLVAGATGYANAVA